MAHLKASPTAATPIIPSGSLSRSSLTLKNRFEPLAQRPPSKCRRTWRPGPAGGDHEGFLSKRRSDWVSLCSSTPAGAMDRVGEGDEGGRYGAGGAERIGYLVREFGWGVRRIVEVEEEMRRVAHVQAEAFHEPVALFDDFFFQFFEAEVLSALIYRIRNSEPNRYACLIAEPLGPFNLQCTSLQELVGVVDATVQRDEDVLRHLEGAEEYIYVSGIAVLKSFRRQKVATALLKSCDVLSILWGHNYLALRAYEDDSAALTLYSRAGYRVVSGDPLWMTTMIGRRRRVLMVKQSSL